MKLDVSGSADLELAELEAREITLELSGSAHVRYHGNPTIEVDQSGSITVIRED